MLATIIPIVGATPAVIAAIVHQPAGCSAPAIRRALVPAATATITSRNRPVHTIELSTTPITADTAANCTTARIAAITGRRVDPNRPSRVTIAADTASATSTAAKAHPICTNPIRAV